MQIRISTCLSIFLWATSVSVASSSAANFSQRAKLPGDEDALSLWLVARTGWVYCDRAAEYLQEVDEDFNETHCKQCYQDLFYENRNNPNQVADNGILSCARNFGAPGAYILREPMKSNGVRAFTCNPEIMSAFSQDPPIDLLGFRESIFEPHRRFAEENEPIMDYPRKSYIHCLVGKIYETEFAMCHPNRRKCAEDRKKEAEDMIFSKAVPISYRMRRTARGIKKDTSKKEFSSEST